MNIQETEKLFKRVALSGQIIAFHPRLVGIKQESDWGAIDFVSVTIFPGSSIELSCLLDMDKVLDQFNLYAIKNRNGTTLIQFVSKERFDIDKMRSKILGKKVLCISDLFDSEHGIDEGKRIFTNRMKYSVKSENEISYTLKTDMGDFRNILKELNIFSEIDE